MTFPQFSQPFMEPAGSPIRELFPYLSQPGMISLAGGYPSAALFDAEGLAGAASRALAEGATALQYGATEGQYALRESLARLCERRGVSVGADEILVTTGSQQGFDLLLRVLIDPGAVALVETPSYPAALQALKLAGAHIQSVPTDANGLDTDRLREMLENADAAARPRLLYTVPTFSNPSGASLTLARRRDLVEMAQKHRLLVIEDDPYGELHFTPDGRMPTLYQIGAELAAADPAAGNPVIYLSSLSKTVAPALRVGWLVAPLEIRRRCAIAKQTSDLCTSPLAQHIAASYLADLARYATFVQRAADEYALRMRTLCTSLRAALPDTADFVTPAGGMFLWVNLDPQTDMQTFFDSAVRAGVLFVPGKAFFPGNTASTAMRLSFASPDAAQIQEAVVRLRSAWLAQGGRAVSGQNAPQ